MDLLKFILLYILCDCYQVKFSWEFVNDKTGLKISHLLIFFLNFNVLKSKR